MKNILYTSFDTVPAPKGAGVHISYFTKTMTENGYNVTLIVPAGKGQKEKDFYLEAHIKRIPIKEHNFLKKTLIFSESVKKELDRDYDLVQFRSIWDGVYVVSKKNKSYKTLYEANGFPSIELPYHYRHLKNEENLLKKIRIHEILCLKEADFIICPSGVIKNYIVSLGIKEDKIKIIPNGVNTDIFRVLPFPPLPLRLLYVGTLAPWQGINLLIDSLSIIKRKDFILNILSDRKKKFEHEITDYASSRGMAEYIKFLDPVNEEKVAHIISESHICFSPLEYSQRNLLQGCCPLKILEYMSCGRPVIGSDMPCVKEIIDHNIDGILCNTANKEELACSILRVAEHPELWEKIGLNASVKARKKYTWHRAGKELLNTIENVNSE
jgi:glycosyltransferase involved in cell wall biosynthesis